MTTCPACDVAGAEVFFARKAVPVHQNLLCESRAQALAVPRGDMALARCPTCGLIFNAAFDPLRLSYEGRYDSNQSLSNVFMAHVDDLVGRLARDGVRGQRVVEVGCGSGYFLKRACSSTGSSGVGFDPGYSGTSDSSDAHVRFVRGLYDPSRVPDVDVILCRHVIEHVQRPVDFVRSVSAGLPASVRFYFETPAFEWILDNTALWDVFHEHCNYFVSDALQNVFRLAGLEPLSCERVFQGQYLWLRAQPGQAAAALSPPDLDVAGFARRCAADESRLRAWVERLSAAGTLAVWGAAAKGATLVNVIDPRGELIRCLTDVNPARHGQFVPGSGHEIVPPAALLARGVSDVIVMNPNYLSEIRALLAELGADLRLHVAGE